LRYCFFFQAEDGIRDFHVTGVQTCALPISAQTFVEDVTLAGIRDADRGFAEKEQMDRLRKYHGDKAQWVLSAWVDTWLSEPFQDWTLSDTLPRVLCPVLAIHGDQDELGRASCREGVEVT